MNYVKSCKLLRMGLALGVVIGCSALLPSASQGQDLFFDDFSKDLSKWTELGEAGAPQIDTGHLSLQWGYGPNWFVTKDKFAFGTDPIRFDCDFVDGGFQQTANYKLIYMHLLLGANDITKENGGVMANFSYSAFNLYRWLKNTAGDLAWTRIPMVGDTSSPVKNGSRISIRIEADGINGTVTVDGVSRKPFVYLDDPFNGGFGFRSVIGRNYKIDDVKFYQINPDNTQTIILEDNFNRTDLGSDWVNESLSPGVDVGALNAHIENGILFIDHDGTGNDTWLRTAKEVAFKGKTTLIEFTLVEKYGSTDANPEIVTGTKKFQEGQTSGVMLIEFMGDTITYDWGMVNGGWEQGHGREAGGLKNGSRIKYVVDKGASSGSVYLDGAAVNRWYLLGPVLQGGFGFRYIVGRNTKVDDVRVYSIDDKGVETTLFSDDFNRTALGTDWVVDVLTPGADASILESTLEDGVLVNTHDGSLNDCWFRTKASFPFGEKTIAFEYTLMERFGDTGGSNPAIVIGTVPFDTDKTIGPLLIDGPNGSCWGMDAREGNVWVGNGPLAGANVSILVNADGMSGTFYSNGAPVKEWKLAAGEAPIPVGAVGFRDPWTPTDAGNNYAVMLYDNARVSKVQSAAIKDWMLE